MKKEICIAALTVVFLVMMVGMVSAAAPIEYFNPIEELPAAIVAGSTYTSCYHFTSTVPVNATISLDIMGEDMGFSEFDVGMFVNNESLNCTEVEAGVFTCDEYNISIPQLNIMDIVLNTPINLQPTDISTILSILVIYDGKPMIYRWRGGLSRESDIEDKELLPVIEPIFTPATMPVPTPSLIQIPTSTPTAAPPPTKRDWLDFGNVLVAIAGLLAVAYLVIRMKKKKE